MTLNNETLYSRKGGILNGKNHPECMEKYITRSYLLNAINNYRRKMEAVGFTQNIVVGLNCEQYD